MPAEAGLRLIALWACRPVGREGGFRTFCPGPVDEGRDRFRLIALWACSAGGAASRRAFGQFV